MSVKPLQRASVNQFLKGLITEANPLEFPENASVDERNMDMDITGRRFRRPGMEVERSGGLVDTGASWDSANEIEYNVFLWEQVAGDSGVDFAAVQVGNSIHFFRPSEEVVSRDGYVGRVDIHQFPTGSRFYMASLDGMLVVVCGQPQIAIIEYNKDAQAFSLDFTRIRIRDVFGVEETINREFETDLTYRGPLNYQHYYNLNNQGWGIPRWDWRRWSNDIYDPVWLAGNKSIAKSPSNSDTVWSGVAFRGVSEDDSGVGIDTECFNYNQFIAITGADLAAGKGYFIIDALDRGSSRVEEWNKNKAKYPKIGGLLSGDFTTNPDRTVGGPSCVCDYSGRIFYSGFSGFVEGGDARSPNFTNYVFFSQLVKNKLDFSKCYQRGDPTGRETADIVDTDGGFLKISEANKILSLHPLGSKLIVIADNGVWAVAGGSDYGFTATNYRVDKLSTFGGLSPSSVVVAGDVVYFMAAEGIYLVASNEIGDLVVQNITDQTIKSFYDSIPVVSKSQAFGIYDVYSKRVRWMYRIAGDVSTSPEAGELILDTQIGAFIPFKIPTPSHIGHYLLSGVKTPPYNTRRMEERVAVGDQIVTLEDGEEVVGFVEVTSPANAAVKYIGVSKIGENIGIYFSRYTDMTFKDWRTVDGVGIDAYAYLQTGTITTGDVAINKQIPYLTVVFESTERQFSEITGVDAESSCIGRFQWDFGEASRSNRWTRDMQLYRKGRLYLADASGDIYDGFSKVITKTKIRGRGKAFSIYLGTEEGKDLQIRGWVLTVTANGVT